MPPEPLPTLLGRLDADAKLPLLLQVPPAPGGKYYHWDELRHRTPPAGLSTEEWWTGVKIARRHLLKPIPLLDKNGGSFFYGLPDPVLRMLHEVDQNASGGIRMDEQVTNPATRDRYIINSLIEESITSSQLEGASTTTEVAKDMLRSGRKPTDRSEQMIFNNFLAMRFVQEHGHEELTSARIFELHRIVTEGTLDESGDAGRFRTEEDRIVVEDAYGTVLHAPPPPAELPERLQRMCEFANTTPEEVFLHPVVRSILLHFWLAYDHPFVDGNGRTARALFYWSMLRQGYWLAEYISISRILRKAPAQYARAFLYTETDDNDLTYFLIHQLRVILHAIADLKRYLRRKVEEVRRVEAQLRQSADLNHRQLALLSHALKHPGHRYTIQSHQRSHSVAYDTARTDLLDLARRGLLLQRKRGRSYVFSAPDDLGDRLHDRGRN